MEKISNYLIPFFKQTATGIVMTSASVLAQAATILHGLAYLPTVAQFGKLCATTFTTTAPVFIGTTAVALVTDAVANALLKNVCLHRPKLNFLLRKTITVIVVSLTALAMGGSAIIPIAALTVLLAKEIFTEWREKRLHKSNTEQPQKKEDKPKNQVENPKIIDQNQNIENLFNSIRTDTRTAVVVEEQVKNPKIINQSQNIENLFNSIRTNARAAVVVEKTDGEVKQKIAAYKQIKAKIITSVEQIKKTNQYYFFFTAMNAGMGFYYDVINYLRGEKDRKTNSFNKKFRLETGEERSLVDIQKQLQKQDDNDLGGLLTSVDANLNNHQNNESAWDFFIENRSVNLNQSNFKEKLTPAITKKLKLKNHLATACQEKLSEGFVQIKENSLTGRMTLIAIKKETIENEKTNYIYSSHPFGKPCTCHSQTEEKEGTQVETHKNFLKKLRDNQEGKSGTCEEKNQICQYRIISDRLEKDPNKAIFYFDTRTPKQKNKTKKVMHAVKKMIDSIKKAKNDKEIKNAINSCNF